MENSCLRTGQERPDPDPVRACAYFNKVLAAAAFYQRRERLPWGINRSWAECFHERMQNLAVLWWLHKDVTAKQVH